MKYFRKLLTILICLLTIARARSITAQDSLRFAERFDAIAISFLTKHCTECHGDTNPKADLNLAGDKTYESIATRRRVWENVLDLVSSGQMPPADKPQPNREQVDAFVALVNEIFEDADLKAKHDPGRVTVRRLNRTEYNNTIRDLMYVDFDAAEDFPSDDIGHGFDNIGDVLTMSPVLMERYLAAAETIVEKAILVGDPPPSPKRQSVATFLKTTKKDEAFEVPFRKLDTVGELSIVHKLPAEGDYVFRFRGWGRQVGDESVKGVLLIDGNEIESFEVKAIEQDKATIQLKPVHMTSGEHKVAIRFLNEFAQKPADQPEEIRRSLFVEYFEFEGPLDTVPVSHRKLLACNSEQSKAEQAHEILLRFLTRAYRRPARADEVDRIVALVNQLLNDGAKWEAAMQRAMLVTLVSPKFLFRLELDDRPQSPEPGELDEFQLASRMSYFLWSSMPDAELFSLASKGELTNSLESQVRRMLADPKSKSLVENFGIQWLQLKRLKGISPDQKQFPTFDDNLRTAMLKETELFLTAIIEEDRSISDLIDADFTYLNEPLAKHYGLEHLMSQPPDDRKGRRPRADRNRDFQRVTLPDKFRGGLLTQASILTVTSNPTRTSPVKRGRWILEQILGTPPPPPPPNVPELSEGESAQLTGSLRQRLEQHRANPACANCHAKMDPLGFAFENYNAVGQFRNQDGGFPIEPSGVLPGGKTFQGPIELKSILIEQRSKVGRNLAEKLLIYGIGRGLESFDRRAIKTIQENLEKQNFKFSALVVEIVKSEPFRMKRGSEEESVR